MIPGPEMPEPGPAARSAPPPAPRALRVLTSIGVFLLGVAVASTCRRDPEEPPAVVQEVRPTPDVITAVRDLARLETVSFHVERVVDLRDRQQVVLGLVEAEDAILLVAAGDVVAGVDLAKLRPEDVEVDPRAGRVRIRLPAPEILSSSLDNDRTFVYARDTDALARRSETLETRARQEAERTLTQAAIEGQILERAERQARAAVTGLVRGLGYADVEVTVRAAE